MKNTLFASLTLALLSTLNAEFSILHAQGTAFTYQGRFTDNGTAYSGSAEFQATLWNAASGGTALASNNPVQVIVGITNGLFVLPLNFGANFPGEGRWLELEVRTTIGAFNVLSPRQPLTATPYAITASNLSGTLPAAQVSGVLPSANLGGTYGGAVTFSNAANSFSGSGGGLANLNASQLASGTVPDLRLAGNVARTNQVWLLGGNTGTTPGTHFLGTTDNQPLELKVNGTRALRLEPTVNDASHSNIVNVVGGSTVNFVAAGVYGATIGGGGAVNYLGTVSTNRVEANFGTVSGGVGNAIQSGATSAAIGGGIQNTIQTNGTYATISGGYINTIQPNAQYAIIGGGVENTILPNTTFGTIGGGYRNTIQPNANFGTIPGGRLNSVASYAFAAGHRAQANHSGAFVWADSQDAEFASTANDQFNIRAAGGVRLSDSTPQLSFGQTVRQMITLYDSGVNSTFGIGVQGSTFYQRCGTGSGFAWYQGGAHDNAQNNSGGGNTLMLLSSGGLTVNGAFVSGSDRNTKENFEPLQPRAVLEKVVALPLSSWNYKADAATRHLGPMAQDFYAAFNVGPDDKHIATVDADGVALAAIQGLNQKLEESRAENAELKQRLEKLEGLMNHQGGGAR